MSTDIIRIVDGYGQKLLSSGYSLEQTRRILVSGILGYKGRKSICEALGRRMKRTAKNSMEDRSKMMLLGRSRWFKGGKKVDYYRSNKKREAQEPEVSTLCEAHQEWGAWCKVERSDVEIGPLDGVGGRSTEEPGPPI